MLTGEEVKVIVVYRDRLRAIHNVMDGRLSLSLSAVTVNTTALKSAVLKKH